DSAGHIVLLKGFGLRIEATNLSFLKFAEPDGAVRIERQSALVGIVSWRHPLLYFECLGIHFADLSGSRIREPDVFILVEGETVRVVCLWKIVVFFRFGVEPCQRVAA